MLEKAKAFIESKAKEVVTELTSGVPYISNFAFFDKPEQAEQAMLNDLAKFLHRKYDKLLWVSVPSMNTVDGKFQPFTRFMVS